MKSKFKVSSSDLCKLLLITTIVTIIAYIIQSMGFIQEKILLMYILGVALVAVCTNGYSTGIISSILNITLRRKIEKQPANPLYIITEIGVGYKLNDE
jgi:two-component system sensor histidine kinase KdpD